MASSTASVLTYLRRFFAALLQFACRLDDPRRRHRLPSVRLPIDSSDAHQSQVHSPDNVALVAEDPGPDSAARPVGLIRLRYGSAGHIRVVAGWHQPGAVPVVKVFESTHSTGGDPATLLALDGFAFLYQHAASVAVPTSLVVGSTALRRELALCREAFPKVVLAQHYTTDGITRHLLRTMDAALLGSTAQVTRSVDRCTTPSTQRQVHQQKKMMRVATDASARRHHRGIGISCVSEDGRWDQAWWPHTADINIGEVEAIRLALDCFPGRDLEIVTDSRNAIAWITDPTLAPNRTAYLAAKRTKNATSGRNVRLTWVKGHSDDRLNLTADRLAVASRRAHDFSLDAETSTKIASSIVAEIHAHPQRMRSVATKPEAVTLALSA